uniref:Pepsin-I3 domain-containing protein n=1 Tax=Caenorhabditis tropicalis TaxID=1561998 RepID=A0A1I7UCQ5_9PELO
MKPATLVLVFALFFTSIFGEESSENVHISGSFRVAGEGEVIPRSSGIEEEHPFFQLEGMKIARAYLDRQYAKERTQREQQFGV